MFNDDGLETLPGFSNNCEMPQPGEGVLCICSRYLLVGIIIRLQSCDSEMQGQAAARYCHSLKFKRTSGEEFHVKQGKIVGPSSEGGSRQIL